MNAQHERKSLRVVRAALLVCGFIALGNDPGYAAVTTTGDDETPWPGGRWEPGPAEYGATIVRNVRVLMNDGVTLNATVGYPSDPSTGEVEREVAEFAEITNKEARGHNA